MGQTTPRDKRLFPPFIPASAAADEDLLGQCLGTDHRPGLAQETAAVPEVAQGGPEAGLAPGEPPVLALHEDLPHILGQAGGQGHGEGGVLPLLPEGEANAPFPPGGAGSAARFSP